MIGCCFVSSFQMSKEVLLLASSSYMRLCQEGNSRKHIEKYVKDTKYLFERKGDERVDKDILINAVQKDTRLYEFQILVENID